MNSLETERSAEVAKVVSNGKISLRNPSGESKLKVIAASELARAKNATFY